MNDILNKKNSQSKSTVAPFAFESSDPGKDEASVHTMKDDLQTIKEGGTLPSVGFSDRAVEASQATEDIKGTGVMPVAGPFLGQEQPTEAPRDVVEAPSEKMPLEEVAEVVSPSSMDFGVKTEYPKETPEKKEGIIEKEVETVEPAFPVVPPTEKQFQKEEAELKEEKSKEFAGVFGDELGTEAKAEKAFEAPTVEPEIPTPPTSVTQEIPSEETIEEFKPGPSVGWRRVFIGVIVFVLVAGALGGGYYFYFMRANGVEEEVVEEVAEEVPEEEIVEEVFDYSLTMPNYLNVDVENVTIDVVNDKISEIFEKFPSGEVGPFEFVLADENYANVTLEKFASIGGIKLPETVVANLGNSFSLFLYKDKGEERVAIAIGFSNESQDDLKTALLSVENELPGVVPDFFAPGVGDVEEGFKFSDSSYMGVDIRYLNVDQENLLSVDYALVNGYLVIATSKDSMRNVIERILVVQGNGESVSSEGEEMSGENEESEILE